MNIEKLEAHLSRHRPRLICTNPTFQNPTGVTTSIAKRHSILALARKHGVSILEDDQNPELRFAGAPISSICALSEPDDDVFFVRGFGKVFLPGTRLGYVVTPARAAGSARPQGAKRHAHKRHHAGGDGALSHPQKLSEDSRTNEKSLRHQAAQADRQPLGRHAARHFEWAARGRPQPLGDPAGGYRGFRTLLSRRSPWRRFRRG